MIKYRLIHQNSNIEVPSGRYDIGRSNECYLVLDDPSVSRVHATIVNQDGKLWVEDRGSRNGCLVNGKQVADKAQLQDGDRLAVGHQTIRIVALDRSPAAEKTLGLSSCTTCGAWVTTTDERCPKCGSDRPSMSSTKEMVPTIASKTTKTGSKKARETQRPEAMITALVQKAINMSKFGEAERLLDNLMEGAIRQRESGTSIDSNHLLAVNSAAITLAVASKSSKMISRLFTLHHALGRLMPRETVESLYNTVRKVGYRSCSEMSSYLDYLKAQESSFSPGEKFIYRRLQGLVGLCS